MSCALILHLPPAFGLTNPAGCTRGGRCCCPREEGRARQGSNTGQGTYHIHRTIAESRACQPKWVSQYDYAAQDEEEIELAEGDVVEDVEEVDEGWVKGTNKRTGKRGMIPSNYIEKQ